MIASEGLDYFSGKEIGQMAQHLMEVLLRLFVMILGIAFDAG